MQNLQVTQGHYRFELIRLLNGRKTMGAERNLPKTWIHKIGPKCDSPFWHIYSRVCEFHNVHNNHNSHKTADFSLILIKVGTCEHLLAITMSIQGVFFTRNWPPFFHVGWGKPSGKIDKIHSVHNKLYNTTKNKSRSEWFFYFLCKIRRLERVNSRVRARDRESRYSGKYDPQPRVTRVTEKPNNWWVILRLCWFICISERSFPKAHVHSVRRVPYSHSLFHSFHFKFEPCFFSIFKFHHNFFNF